MFRLSIFAPIALALFVSGCTTSSALRGYDATYTANSAYGSTTPIKSTVSDTAAFAPRSNRRKPAFAGRKPYFIEFRARTAYTYGHASVVLGELDRNGRVPRNSKGVLTPGITEIAGLHPASTSVVPFTVGHVVPVPAETGPSDGDHEDAYATAKYTIKLTPREFDRAVDIVRKHKREGKFWHAGIYACVPFIRHIARDLGLNMPRGPHLPENFVKRLKALNT